MRKINVCGVKSDFAKAVKAQKTLWRKINDSKALAPELNQLAEHLLLYATVLWEVFVSDLFISYVNNDHSAAQAALLLDSKKIIQQKLGQAVSDRLKLELPLNLNADEAARILDDEDRNLTFKSAALMVAQAERLLAKAHRRKFTRLRNEDVAVIDAIRSIRNALAHRSAASLRVLNVALDHGDLKNFQSGALSRGVNNVKNIGAYLTARPGGSTTPRIVIALDALLEFSRRL